MAVLLCVNFASCSEDDDEEEFSSGVEKDIPANTIRYQTVNGTVVSLDNEDVFGGAEIVSNTYSNGYGTIEFATDVTEIEERAFYENETLSSIVIPNSVANIGESAFDQCISLKKVTMSNGLVSIGDEAFCGCSSLEYIYIPNSVKRIGYGVFYGCGKLKIELDCESIGGWFYKNADFKEVILGNNVKVIGNDAFYGCDGLTSITIGNSVASIGDEAFAWCDGLTSITIPNSVTSIGEGAFDYCGGLTSVYVKWNTPIEWHDYFGYETCEKATLYVPKGSLEAYKAADGWNEFEDIREY